MSRLSVWLRRGLRALRHPLGGDGDADGARSDLVLVGGLVVGVYALFTVMALLGPFDGVGNVLSQLETVTLLVLVYVMLALALNLQWGYAGLLNLGVAGFMAIGAYTMAMLSAAPDATVPGLGLPLVVGIVGGFLAATLFGALTALPAIRLRADYLAIVTLAFSEIIRLVVRSEAASEFTIAGQRLGTGGANTFPLPPNPVKVLLYENPSEPLVAAVDSPTVAGDLMLEIADVFNLSASQAENILYTLLLLIPVGAFYLLLTRIGNSPFGRVLRAIREDELVAGSLGKNTRRFKITTFAVGCGLMGLAAILWQLQGQGRLSPGTFEPELTFFVFVALILGGSGSNTGSVVGGIVFAAVLLEGPRALKRVVDENFDVSADPDTIIEASQGVEPLFAYLLSDSSIEALRFIMLGVVLVYLMQRQPQGLLGHRRGQAATVSLPTREEEEP